MTQMQAFTKTRLRCSSGPRLHHDKLDYKGLQVRATASPYSSGTSSWFSSAGIECIKIQMTTSKGLRGMIARENINAKEVFASVPHNSALVLQPAKKCPFPEFCLPEYWKTAPWFVRLGLMLLYEKHVQGPQSRHIHYIEDLMAIKIETPLVWSKKERAELQYPWLEDQIEKQIKHWTDLYNSFKEKANCSVKISKEEFFWALQAVRSRAFSGPYGGPPLRDRAKIAFALGFAGFWSLQIAHLPTEQVLNAGIAAVLFNILYDVLMSQKLKRYAMLPAIDYINHSATIESDISYEVFRDRFIASTSTPFKKGDEVSVSYGRHNNDYLLQFFGFYIPELAYDSYTISTTGETLKNGTAFPDQITLIRSGLSSATKEWVDQSFDKILALKAVSDRCKKERENWSTSVQEDRKRSKLVSDDRSLLACQFRIEKKSLLESCLRKLEK